MVGITLTPEQIKGAPVEVRRWMEREVAASLGLQPEDGAQSQIHPQHPGRKLPAGGSRRPVDDTGHVPGCECVLRTRPS